MEKVSTEKIPLGLYMWTRLHQVGINTIFGVPGDFNLQFLDFVYQVPGLSLTCNQNELNAAYAADGYARVKGAPGCLVTTHGVGELSALNGIAGSMSEHVKVIHVVGQTTRAMQKNHMMIHHSIGHCPDHQLYNKASAGLRYAAAELWDVETAPAEIDRVIRECFLKSGPVYIFLPLDLSTELVDRELLDTPIDVEPSIHQQSQQAAVEAILSAFNESKHPLVMVDAWVQRFGAEKEAQQFVRRFNVPLFATNMGKGIVDETEPTYVGIWNGEVSSPGVKEAAKQADLIVTLGFVPCDTNSAGFSRKVDDEMAIHINPHDVVVKGKIYQGTSIRSLITALTSALPSVPIHNIAKAQLPPLRTPLDRDATHLTQSFLWPSIQAFLRPGDIIVGETGTTNSGLCDMTFPENVQLVTQVYYGSIGFATAATLGVDIARRELEASGARPPGRTILCTGDGSMALTIQEVGTMIKNHSNAIVFVLNNDGYTIERLIWGAQQPYNDIVPHNYSHLLPLYHHPSPSSAFHRASSKQHLTTLLAAPLLQDPPTLQLVELILDRRDTSWKLGTALAWRGEAQRAYLTREGFVDTYGGWGLDGEGDAGEQQVRWS